MCVCAYSKKTEAKRARRGEKETRRLVITAKKLNLLSPLLSSLSLSLSTLPPGNKQTHHQQKRDKPPTLTDGEKAAALYNAACAHASLGDKRAALDALSAAVGEAGFADGRAAAEDGDLASLRGDPAFEALVGRLRAAQDKEEQRKKKGFLGGLFG